MDHGDILNCKIFSEAIMAFPPVPVYPQAIDSDYTLYLVYDTTETRLAVDNSAWSQEIDISISCDHAELSTANLVSVVS